jgi:sphingomyelin phosphodiesterase
MISYYGEQYTLLLQKYRDTVVASFGGHMHKDTWESFVDKSTRVPLSTHFVCPSATTEQGLSPSYRVVVFNTTTYELLDIHTYAANLSAANTMVRNPTWYGAYSFRGLYNLPHLTPRAMDHLNHRLSTEPVLFQKYIRNFFQQQVDPPGPTRSCDQACEKSQLCFITTATQDALDLCLAQQW